MIKKILIIDDEKDIIKILTYRLKAKGFCVFEAFSGESGIDMAKVYFPDIILLDYRLPDMLAVDVVKKIREDEKLKYTPIILITASIQDVREKAKKCEVSEYITKPIDPEELYKKIEKFM